MRGMRTERGRGRGRGRGREGGVAAGGEVVVGEIGGMEAKLQVQVSALAHQKVFTEWESDCSPVTVQPFTETTGVTVQTTGEPGNFFSLFFTPEIIQVLVQETNRYAALCQQGKEAWSTDEQELRVYFGFYILTLLEA